MSSVDPFTALFAQNAAEVALADLQLGIPVELIQVEMNVGDLLAATVLPARNGHDVLEILGKQIVAQLPPSVRPGDTLLLEVTGSSGSRVLVSNLGTIDPEQPLPVAVLQAAEVVEKAQEPPVQPQSPAPQQETPPPVAPPRAVFVAASVTRSPVAESAPNATQSAPLPPPGVEARIAAMRAAAAQTAPPRTAGLDLASPPQRIEVAAAKPAPAPFVSQPVVAHDISRVEVRAQTSVPNAPERLLQTLRVPVTTATIAAARAAAGAARRLPEVLTRLEQALTAVTKDARAATLRTISAFVARIDPSNEAALPQQIASYVSHIADGPESKVVDLLRAFAQDKSSTPEDPAVSANALRDEKPSVTPSVVAEARTVERAAAADHDLKSLVLSLVTRPPVEHTPELAQALREAAVTLTGAQLQNLQNNPPSSPVISLTLPVFYKEGGQAAQLRIDRKHAKASRDALNGDDFHVAFVLDTAALGTVAIDLQASQRRVTVNVKTETEKTVVPFKSTLSDLVGRLEQLRYRVARTNAEVAPRTSPAPSDAAAGSPSGAGDRALDFRA